MLRKLVIFMAVGVVCEFNPFHNGHKYLIDSLKSKGESVVCCMSGNFVQRGEFAIYDKFKRTEAAIKGGADLVIELPAKCSTLSAEGFAKSSINLLESTGIVNKIAFGAEYDNVDELKKAANLLNDEETQKQISDEMKSGVSYPVARKNVLNTDLLDTPNNILAVEYLRFTNLEPIAIKRIGKGHDTDDAEYSASAIRNNLKNDNICSMKNCETAILAKLRQMSAEDFLKTADVNEGLENRIVNAVRNASSLDELYDLIKTKRYTMARIRRIVLRSYLSITTGNDEEAPYIRILGFNNEGKKLLSDMKKNAKKPIITKISDCDGTNRKYFEDECRYTDLYNLGYKKPLPCGTEQRSKIVII